MKVEKRDGRIVTFDATKIEYAIQRAFESDKADISPVKALTDEVVNIITDRKVETIHIEEIQDIVEDVLMLHGHTEIAKRYIKYREKRAVARRLTRSIGVVDDLKLGPNAAIVAKRYLLKDDEGNAIETPSQLFRRVAKAIAGAEKLFDKGADVKTFEELFYKMIVSLEFMPNSPTLFNAGTDIGQLSACFVLPIEDDIDSIFTTLHHMARVQKSGGGCIREGTQVMTREHGLIPIEQIPGMKEIEVDGQPHNIDPITLYSWNPVLEVFEEKTVNHGWKFHLDKIARIKYGSNGTVETSCWHPFYVWDGETTVAKRADELVPGDTLLKNGIFDIPMPEKNSSLWWLIGYIIADGSLDHSVNGLRLRLFDEHKEILERANKIISRYRGTSPLKLQKDSRENCYILQTTARRDDSFVSQLFDIIGEDKLNPQFIPEAPLSFIAGLLDGDAYFGRNTISLYTPATTLKDFVCNLLATVGVNYKVRSRTRKRFGVLSEGWEIAFAVGYGRKFPTVRQPRLNKNKPFNFRRIRVQEVEIKDEAATLYDFTVPLNQNYLAGNGHLVVVHNTGFAFSNLRPKGAMVGSTGGVASGPVSFMRVYDTATDVIKQGGCLSTETLVQTNKGLRRIGSLVNGRLAEETPLNELVLTRNDFKQAYISANNGLTDVIRIETHLGYSLGATYNHKLRVLTSRGIEWKSAERIEAGDWLVMKRGWYQGFDKALPSIGNQHHNATPITLPEVMNPELGEVLGYFIGEGCLSTVNNKKSRLVFSVSHHYPDIASWIETFFQGFGLTPFREQKEGEACWSVHVRSVAFAEWWMKSGFDKESSRTASIPPAIFTSSKRTVCGFLRGLFEADGDVTAEGYARFSSTSKILIDQVQQLLLSLGIISKKYSRKNRISSYGKNPLYSLTITHKPSLLLFSESIGFKSMVKHKRMAERITRASGAQSDPIPFAESLIARHYKPPGRGNGKNRGPRSSNPRISREVTRYLHGQRHPNRQRLLQICNEFTELKEMSNDEVLRDDLFYAQVTNLSTHEAYTGDIEVIGEEFVANGFLVHNRRRGANMAILRCDHPDILEFISAKADKKSFRNFNISVAVTDEFMKALEENGTYDLINPHTKEVEQAISARMVFDSIVLNAWNTGDPGIIFIDRINREHPLKGKLIESTNPCGEMPLLPYESCVLGSINLAKMVKDGDINWKRLDELIPLAVRFLDNVIDLNKYPVEEIAIQTKATRKIGLGVMGWTEMLIQLGIPYDSKKALETADRVMKFIRERAERASRELAKIRGNFEHIDMLKQRRKWKRNATLITIAPTGSISLIAGTSSGIEPLYAIVHDRILADGVRLTDTNKYFLQIAEERGFWSETIEQKVASTGSVQDIDGIPDDVKHIFKTAHEIEPEWHVRMQAAFQRHVGNAVSKTVNLPNHASTEDVRRTLLLANELELKGITIFRDGSLEGLQVLYAGCPTCDDVRFPESP